MNEMTRQEIAEYVLDELKKAGAQKASCAIASGRKEEFNIEANKFTLLRTLFDDALSVKALYDGRKGVAAVNKLDKDSIDGAIGQCIALAKAGTPDEAEDIAEKIENKGFSRTIGGSDMNKLFSRTKEYLQQVQDEYPKIILEGVTSAFNAGEGIYANSNGVMFTDESEGYGFSSSFVAKDGEKSSSLSGFGAGMLNLDMPLIAVGLHRTMIEESVKSLDTRMVDGKYVGKVIVTPQCDDMIWGTIIDCFLSDRSLIEGTSRWKDRLGKKVADKKLTLRAVPLHPGIIGGERFTRDGYESFDADLISGGILESFALSLYGANKTGNKRAKNTAFGNIEIAPGDVALCDMIKSIDKGILLNRFAGAAPGPGGDVSGVAKNSFLIENGAITDALSETMVSFNIVDILQDITAISKERVEDGSSILPWCCFDGITISGK
ncbi:MAG: TldD/PmbA family protein [Oscillospiraceae bacterium]|nr:TldD/PmbA family protein [Oscillospiraceae bacterium]